MKKIGILGGTFDPIHNAHLKLAETAFQALTLDTMLIMPAGVPYFKEGKKISRAEHRLEMCRLAVQERTDFSVSDIEILRGGRTYTADTLASLKKTYPDAELYFCMGADSLFQITSWYHPESIMRDAALVLMGREVTGAVTSLEDRIAFLEKQYGARIHLLKCPRMQLSSTMIRNKVIAGEDITGLVPDRVRDYILKEGLYKDGIG